ncbi:hypothetical protein [Parachitinimonas caeni]|uniref:Uncharacterized protein n=1 Tax=Parachitinimonas caeni TaxID=3031301 RepID=A0ABT7E146_9NEIS|nr:hypothetical protein [Parachitinimonas caeni]MDK2126016.1 hypothetical protein [Parachitinimonas caeni]
MMEPPLQVNSEQDETAILRRDAFGMQEGCKRLLRFKNIRRAVVAFLSVLIESRYWKESVDNSVLVEPGGRILTTWQKTSAWLITAK